jgi:hypothetical protein
MAVDTDSILMAKPAAAAAKQPLWEEADLVIQSN